MASDNKDLCCSRWGPSEEAWCARWQEGQHLKPERASNANIIGDRWHFTYGVSPVLFPEEMVNKVL